MFKATPKLVISTCVVATVVLAALKFASPHFTFNSGLILVILLTSFVRRKIYTYVFGVIALLIIILPVLIDWNALSSEWSLTQFGAAGVALISVFAVIYIKNLNRSMEYDRKQMNALFEYATEGIVLTNGKGEIVLANPEARRLFKYENDELIGRPFEILLPGRLHKEHIDYRNNFYKDPASRNMGHGKYVYAVKKNGEEFPVEMSLSYYEQQKDYFILAFIIDITERKVSEQKLVTQKEQLEKVTSDIRKLNVELENKVGERTLILQEALQELERSQMELSEALSKEKELNEIKSRFVSMASHEFRTPLSTILSSAALLSRYTQTEDQDKREKHIRRVKESVKHLNDLLEDFLNLGKLEEGRVFTRVVKFNVKEQVKDVIDEIKLMLKEGQDMILNYQGDEYFITDNRLLKNILINLLSNAIKFSDEGKQIYITVNNSGSDMIVEVKDQGIGIAKEDMQHMFSTFYRGRNAVNIQGTGLGLHIVRRYVNLLKGNINMESELNEGTTINIALPQLETEPV